MPGPADNGSGRLRTYDGRMSTPSVSRDPAPDASTTASTTKRVLLAAPRGYCAGVDRAVVSVE